MREFSILKSFLYIDKNNLWAMFLVRSYFFTDHSLFYKWKHVELRGKQEISNIPDRYNLDWTESASNKEYLPSNLVVYQRKSKGEHLPLQYEFDKYCIIESKFQCYSINHVILVYAAYNGKTESLTVPSLSNKNAWRNEVIRVTRIWLGNQFFEKD